MAINYDALPTEAPVTLLENGKYPMTIKKAEMKAGNNGDYLVVTFGVDAGGNVYDNFFDSDKPLPRYKLGQLIRATKIQLHGTFELKDLAKIIVNKRVMGAVKKEQNEGYAPRNVIDAFDDQIFEPIPDTADVPFTMGEPAASGETPFNASDSY